MTNLKEVKFGHNKFCGPAVLSILTGKDTDECAQAIRKVNRQYEVAGVLIVDLIKAAENLGFKAEQVAPVGSLFRSLHGIVNNNGIYIVMVLKHFVVVEVNDKHIYFCDNHTKEPIPAASSARLGVPVLCIYKVSRNENFVEQEEEEKKPEYDIVIMYRCKECKSMAPSVGEVNHYYSCSWRK